jgi:1-acyl-sn-glycerol-3-phosphate acyltransferase
MVRQVLRLLYGALFVFAHASYFIGQSLFSVFWLPLLVFVSGRRRRRVVSWCFHMGISFFILGYFRWLRAYHLGEVSGRERARAAEPVVYVANHRGRMDGLFVLTFVRRTGVIMKSSYIRSPLFAPFARHLDFVSVDPGSLDELSRTLERCRGILAEGRNLLVFPEGTRAPGPRLLPFKDIAFRLARDAGVPVVPVVVHNDVPVLGKRMARIAPRRPFVTTVRFLEPTRCGEEERPAEFASRVQRLMARELRDLDRGTDWERLAAVDPSGGGEE